MIDIKRNNCTILLFYCIFLPLINPDIPLYQLDLLLKLHYQIVQTVFFHTVLFFITRISLFFTLNYMIFLANPNSKIHQFYPKQMQVFADKRCYK